MFKIFFSLIKRNLAIVALLAAGSAGIGLVTGSLSASNVNSTLEQAPPNTQLTSTSTSLVTNSTTATSTIPIEEPGFIDTTNREATIAAWTEINSRPRHKMKWTGNVGRCDAGTTTQEFKEDVLARVKWFRAMAGVDSNISLNLESSRLAQEAALVMKANNDLSHEPPDSWDCFSDEAYDGASRSNLFLGVFGVPSIDGYIEDSGSENYSVGHRRWILDPTLAEIGTGDTNNTNALFVINERTRENFTTREQDGFVMWPPRGYVPRATIFPRWSISHQQADFSNATVRIDFQGRTRIIKDAYSDTEGIGSLNTLVFNWIRPSKGTGSAVITVANIELNGTQRSISYEITPFG